MTRYSIVPTLQWCVALNCRCESSRVTAPLHLSDSSQPLSFVSKIQHGSCTHSRWALHLHTLNKHLFLCVGILVHMSNTGFRPFFEQEKFKDFSRTFQGLSGTYFPFSRTLFSAKKSLVLPQHEQFYPKGLSAFAPFSLEFYLNYRVSIEIQGLSSTDCDFQGLSRPWIFLLKYCQ